MQAINVLYGQELADLCAEHQIFEAADLNGIGITDALTPGVTLSVPTASKPKITDEIIAKAVKPVELKAAPGQTWVDLALQQLGDEQRIFELCDGNGAGITDELAAGSIIICPRPSADKLKIVKALTLRKPSSVFIGIDNPAPEGIEYWAIEIDFVVS